MNILSKLRRKDVEVSSANVEPVVHESDLPFLKQIMGLVKQEEEFRDIQPRLRMISADDYIVETITVSGGRNPMPCPRTHDLRTREGRNSFRNCCQEGLIGMIYFLDNTSPARRASIYKSQQVNEFHRDDLEPWISVVGVIRKWDGYIS